MSKYEERLQEGIKTKLIIGVIIAVIGMLIVSISGNAQLVKKEVPKSIVIGQLKNAGYTGAELSYQMVDNDTLFILLYRDMQYTQLVDYKTIAFSSDGNTLEELYQLLKTTMDKEKGYTESFKLGETNIRLKKDRMMGVDYIWIHEDKGYFQLTMKQLNKLFGKN